MKGAGVLGLAALAAVAAWLWKREADVQDLANKLIDTLPSRLGQWGVQLGRAANLTSPASLSTMKWALFVAAIMDRESGGGIYLHPRGPAGRGDFQDKGDGRGVVGRGLGLMQLDIGAHPDLEAQPEKWQAPSWNIEQGARELRGLYTQLPAEMDQAEKFQRTADGYNAGPRALRHPDPDSITTGKNYGSDVVARAAAFEEALA